MHVFCFKQKTAYEMRISDWSSDVCSSDLSRPGGTIASSSPLSSRRWAKRASRTRSSRTGGRSLRQLPVPPTKLSQDLPPARERGGSLRSEERRVGEEGVSTCRSRWSQYH